MEKLQQKFENTPPAESREDLPKSENTTTISQEKQTLENQAARIETAQIKIADQDRINQIREKLGAGDADSKIQQFVTELPSVEGYVDFSQLKKIGHGGTHDVFRYPQDAKFVIKMKRETLKKALEIGQGSLPADMKPLAEQYISEENAKNEQLYNYFGQEHCLREKVMLQKMAIEKDGVIQNIEGVLSIQEASDAFADPDKKDLSTNYTEQDSNLAENKDFYDRMNQALLGEGEFDEKDFLKFNEKLSSVFELIDSDTEFADCMREFLVRFQNYFEASGRFIDLVGQYNVLFHRKEGRWTFTLGSVVKGENKEVMQEAMRALDENPESISQDKRIRGQLMNQLALIRLLNASGLKTGIGKIIDLRLSDKQLENLDKITFND